jgi:hypothetical protein
MFGVLSADGQTLENDEASLGTEEGQSPVTSLEDALVSVWRQVLVDDLESVKIDDQIYTVKSTPRRGLKQVDFRFGGKTLRALEQNPDTESRWAALARAGKKVMQFLDAGRYLAVVSDGKVHLYKKSAKES